MKKAPVLIFASFLFIFTTLGQLWLPWWIIMLIAFVSGSLFLGNALKAFIIAFFVITLEWLVLAYLINQKNDFILAQKMTELFQLNNVHLLLIVSAVIAGIAAAFSAASGALLRGIVRKN
ncbi:MAG: hypothetical protein WD048_08760 [Chitinophagales bacterium]